MAIPKPDTWHPDVAAFGEDRDPTSADPTTPVMVALLYEPVHPRSGALIGLASVQLPYSGIIISKVPVHTDGVESWAASIRRFIPDGGGTFKRDRAIRFACEQSKRAFSDAVITAIRERFPDALPVPTKPN